MLVDNKKTIETDKRVDEDISGVSLSNHIFVRLGAKNKKFTNVNFAYTIFDHCYLRKCVFDSCDFTGARFNGSNLHESSFVGCKFDYCYFERTLVESDILDSSCPAFENLKLKFARTLRMNYQQLGDAQSVNKAIKVELKATEVHLRKSCRSNESYYRQKYRGWKRVKAYIDWMEFKTLDAIWGNGESVIKLIRAVCVVIVSIGIIDFLELEKNITLGDLTSALLGAPEIFIGVLIPEHYPKLYLTGIALVRLISIGFFLSIIVKRFNRR